MQLQWYMGLLDDMEYSVSKNGIVSDSWTMPVADHAILTVFYRDTGDIDSIPVYRDDRLISDMKHASQCFIVEHVTPKIPPLECDDDSVRKIYSVASGKEMDATGELVDAAKNYIECRALEKKWGDSKKESAAFLRSQLRDCNSSRWDMDTSSGSVTWRNSKGKRAISYETMARDLAEKLGLGLVELCDRYKIEKPGVRTLRVNYKGRDDEQGN
jgi:hypothetical protein